MQVDISHIECDFPFQNTSIKYLVYACADQLSLKIEGPKSLVPKEIFKKYGLPIEISEHLVGYQTIEFLNCGSNPEKCHNKQMCEMFGNCELDRKSGHTYRTVFIYVHPDLRRRKIAWSINVYFKNLTGQYTRPSGLTKYGAGFVSHKLSQIQQEKTIGVIKELP